MCQEPELCGDGVSTGCGTGGSQFSEHVGTVISRNIAVRRAPNCTDVPSQQAELCHRLEGTAGVFVVVLIKLKCVGSCLVVDTYENPRTWSGKGEKEVDGFLNGVKFCIVNFCPIAEIAAPLFDPEELLVANVENYPPASGCPIVKLGAIRIYDNGVVRK